MSGTRRLIQTGPRPASARAARRLLALLSGTSLVALAGPALAQGPTGESVASGTVSVSRDATLTRIDQTSQRALVNWTSFDTDAAHTVQVSQPSADALLVNRVHGSGTATTFNGTLTANGQVVLLNDAGVLIGADARINTAGFLATTTDVDMSSFASGPVSFNTPSTVVGAGVVNAGIIRVNDGGFAALAAATVENSGLIEAQLSAVTLAGGQHLFTLDVNGDGLLRFQVQDAQLAGTVLNTGTLRADGGTVLMTARGARDAMAGSINTSGIIEARSASDIGGRIIIEGGDEVDVQIANSVSAGAAGSASGGVSVKTGGAVTLGGTIETASGDIQLEAGGTISAGSASLTTQGGAIVLASNQVASGGGIRLTDSQLTSNGGEVILAGTVSADNRDDLRSNGAARGRSADTPDDREAGAGIILSGTTISSGAGAITLNGEGVETSPVADGGHGVWLRGGSQLVTSSGSITLTGAGLNADGISHGILIEGSGTAVQTTSSGGITLTGRGNGDGTGVALSDGAQLGMTDVYANITITASDVDFAGGHIRGIGGLFLSAEDLDADMGIGDVAFGDFHLGQSDLDALDATLASVWIGAANGNNRVRVGDAAFTGNTQIVVNGTSGRIEVDGAVTSAGLVELAAGATVVLRTGSSITTSGGSIDLSANTGGGAVGGEQNGGIRLDGTVTLDAGGGDIRLTGRASVGNALAGGESGISMGAGSRLLTSGYGTVTLDGTGGDMGGSSVAGVRLNGAGISTEFGSISITGNGGDFGYDGIRLADGATVQSTGGGAITLTGRAGLAGGKGIVLTADSALGSDASGDITLRAGSIDLSGNGNIAGQGSFRLRAIDGETPIGIGDDADGVLILTRAAQDTLKQGFDQIVIGSTDGPGRVTITDGAFKDDLRVEAGAGIEVTGSLTGAGDVHLKAGTDIAVDGGVITSQGGDITLQARAFGSDDPDDGTSGAILVANGASILSNGGDIALVGGSGGSDYARAGGMGPTNGRGVLVSGSTLDAAGGDITLRGRGGVLGNTSIGVELAGATLMTGDAGEISVRGVAGFSEGTTISGLHIADGSLLRTAAGRITLAGWADSGGFGQTGISFGPDGASPTRIYSTGGGRILLRVPKRNGRITNLTAAGGGTPIIGGDGAVTYASPIEIAADQMVLGSGFSVRSSDSVTVRPYSGGYDIDLGSETDDQANTLELSADELALLGLSTPVLRIGAPSGDSPDGTGAVLISRSLEFRDGLDLALAGDSIEQDAGTVLSVDRLSVDGWDHISLTGANRLSILESIRSRGDIDLRSSGGDLSVAGTVASADGAVTLAVSGGDLRLSGDADIISGGGDVVLATDRAFVADASSAVSASGRTILYADSRRGTTLGPVSGQVILGRTFAGNPPGTVTETGNLIFYANGVVLTLTADDLIRLYGQNNPAFTYSISGFVDGDDVANTLSGTPLFTTLATAGSGVGSYAITLAAGTLANSKGYIFNFQPGTLTIDPAALTIRANDARRTYGAANPTFTASYEGLVNGDTASVVSGLQLGSTATAGSGVGRYVISAGGASAANYAISYVDGALTIDPAALTIRANDARRTYGAANPTFTASYEGLVNGDTASVVSGLQLGSTATAGSGVGRYVISAGGASAANYAISYVDGALTIDPAALTIRANDARRTYGAANPTFTASYEGLVNGDTASVVSGLSFATGATTQSPAGAYAITPFGGVAQNYTITYVPGLLTVEANGAALPGGVAPVTVLNAVIAPPPPIPGTPGSAPGQATPDPGATPPAGVTPAATPGGTGDSVVAALSNTGSPSASVPVSGTLAAVESAPRVIIPGLLFQQPVAPPPARDGTPGLDEGYPGLGRGW
ncbi:MBG domain-containing protein [Oleisolibacter albus]|uniref:MBG domain-containing protein n=1 Tax=Oleisolibacter albus TaxID=2171757 RepID=UPI000DF4BC48|nr:MBG domain-containing protein [Oleisolibacter albus]